ncbi:MAG: PAS domain S-box protein [Ignavibacteriae bacterium]|nr:PAS domain S-box protein [Ignavibacteriota bacterium]
MQKQNHSVINIESQHKEKSYNLINTALEAAANGVVITDITGQIIYINNSYTKLTGYSKEEMINQNPRVLKSGIHNNAFYRNMWDTINKGQIWFGVITNKKKDGSFYFEEMTITPVKNSFGEIENFIAVKQDITIRKKMEEELKHNNYKFKKMIENSTLGIMRIDNNGKIIMANPAMFRMLKYNSQSEMITQEINRIYYSLNSRNKFLQILAREGKISGYEEIFVERDGNLLEVKESAWQVKDKNNEILYYEVFVEDITEQKKIYKKLNESEYKYKILIDKLYEAVYLLIGNKLEIANLKFLEMLEITEEEIYKSDFNLLNYVSEESKEMLKVRTDKIKNGEDVEKKYFMTIKTKNGFEKNVEVSTSYLTFNDKIATQGVIREVI